MFFQFKIPLEAITLFYFHRDWPSIEIADYNLDLKIFRVFGYITLDPGAPTPWEEEGGVRMGAGACPQGVQNGCAPSMHPGASANTTLFYKEYEKKINKVLFIN